ncbi:MAG TPA: hypothetical protein VM101_00675 [Flavitalea sp.]|nr:hypothetical protein [Flavitalea sp.]
MRLIHVFLLFSSFAFFLPSFAQNIDFAKVDDFRVNDSKVKVYFKDPLAVLVSTLPDFDKKPDYEKNKLLKVYLQNHDVYLFSVTSKEGKVISYVLRGDPDKKETSQRYSLDVTDGDVLNASTGTPPAVRKTVTKLDIAGEFFEHMAPFRQQQFRKVTTSQVWGNIVHINPYPPIKDAVEKIIQLDQTTGIPDDMLKH